jgi:hypothetical protein
MSEGIAVEEQRRPASRGRTCQHRWIIETPNGATSRGLCRRCGATKRFPNAADDRLWDSDGRSLGRWSARRGITRPEEISLRDGGDDEV